ncbi:hypothetical protein [Brevundimonas sp.]|uniref:hypothetical protein n=1 Tax=Brevundimonas sp. TaxID=1871086 RepID=UPI0025C2D8D0|nr:hypothetical protein [Brevundimonas sp.]
MEISPFDQEFHPKSGGLREAFAAVAERRCGGSFGTLGRVQHEWSLSADEAKGLLKGQTSIRTMEKVLQHKNGGWKIGVMVLAIVTGRRLTDYFASEKQRLNHEAEQRRRQAVVLEEAESFLHAADVEHHALHRGSDLDPVARGGAALLAS